MGKSRGRPEPTDPGGTKPISYKPSKPIEAGLAKYRGTFEYAPSKSAVIERALREFLRKHGIDVPGGDE